MNNDRRNPHAQRLRLVALDVQRRPQTVRLAPQPIVKTPIPPPLAPIDPQVQYLIKLGRAERKNMIETVQKIVYDNHKNGDLNVSVETDELDDVLRDLRNMVDDQTTTTTPTFEGSRTQEDDDDITQLKRSTFLYDS